jgi:hypothetical protein
MSVRWDMLYKRASCESLTRVGSDHCPILVNSDDQRFQQQHCFRFESAWLLQQGFREAVIASWPERGGQKEGGTVQDYWRDVKAATRKFCKGWGANVNSQIKREKRYLLKKLQEMDRVAD